MRVHVESENKRESPVNAREVVDEDGEKRLEFDIAIDHNFGVRVVEPKAQSWSPTDHFNVPAAILPPDTKCGDEFMVFFERAKTK